MTPYQREEFDLAEHRAVVLGFVHRMLGRRELAEELTQGCLATRRAKESYLSGKRLSPDLAAEKNRADRHDLGPDAPVDGKGTLRKPGCSSTAAATRSRTESPDYSPPPFPDCSRTTIAVLIEQRVPTE